MDVWDFFERREGECRECSLVSDVPFPEMCGAAADSNGKHGIFFGRFTLTERASLHVFESLVVRGNAVRRERYSYYLIIDGNEIWGYDRDPGHSPSTHRHEGAAHTRFPSAAISFKEVANKAWATVSAYEVIHPGRVS